MKEKKSYESWRISDKFWEVVKNDIPRYERDTNATQKREISFDS